MSNKQYNQGYDAGIDASLVIGNEVAIDGIIDTGDYLDALVAKKDNYIKPNKEYNKGFKQGAIAFLLSKLE